MRKDTNPIGLKLDKPIPDVLTDAAEILEKHGWTKGRYQSGPACCVVGAIARAYGFDPDGYDDPDWAISVAAGTVENGSPAFLAFRDALDGTDPTAWNDRDRTKDEVIAKLKEVADASK